ncbi:MAG: hypothetical protein ACI9WU_003853 [Myxococcota bacterium]|jgi:hypothetical protein
MTLPQVLLDDERRQAVVADCQKVLESEVGSKGGVSGFAIKAGYKVVRKLDGGRLVPKAINDLLPEFCDAWEPFHADYRAGGQGTFQSFSRGKETAMANALLAITDGKAVHARNQVLKKVYTKLRPMAVRNIEDAMPRVTGLVDQHAG